MEVQGVLPFTWSTQELQNTTLISQMCPSHHAQEGNRLWRKQNNAQCPITVAATVAVPGTGTQVTASGARPEEQRYLCIVFERGGLQKTETKVGYSADMSSNPVSKGF